MKPQVPGILAQRKSELLKLHQAVRKLVEMVWTLICVDKASSRTVSPPFHDTTRMRHGKEIKNENISQACTINSEMETLYI